MSTEKDQFPKVCEHSILVPATYLTDLRAQLAAVTAERDALALPRPYDTYWSRRALELEKELAELRAATMKVTTQATLDHVSIPSPSKEEPKMDKPYKELYPQGWTPEDERFG